MKILSSYGSEELMAATPSRLVVMLYDEAIGALRTAAIAARNGEIEQRFNATIAAGEIIGYLYMNLDVVHGGEIADSLGAIYAHVLRRLPQVNVHNDADVAEEAIRLLRPLRRSWVELDRLANAGEDAMAGFGEGATAPAAASAMNGRRPVA